MKLECEDTVYRRDVDCVKIEIRFDSLIISDILAAHNFHLYADLGKRKLQSLFPDRKFDVCIDTNMAELSSTNSDNYSSLSWRLPMGFFDWLFGSKMKAEIESYASSEISGRTDRQRIESVRKTEATEAEVDLSGEFIFTAVNQDSKELSQCKIGDFVKFWYDSELERIRIYRRGSVGGPGRIGDVPWEYYDIILNHLQQKLERGYALDSPGHYI